MKKLLRDELYVMLMLQRSEENGAGVDCDDTDVVLACLEDLDNCPAACKADYEDEGETSDEVVKSGDLAVSANAAAGRKILINGISDLDTLTFKTSEEVTLTKVILERYGYSQNDDVVSVWLEDEDGNIIADGKPLDAKGQAKLSIKKDYRTIDGTYTATIVVNAKGTGGNTMGFKVVDVESSAKNLNVDNYTPYTYDMVAYQGATVTLSTRESTKDYNYEAGESYEVAKFKVQAPADSAVNVRGFSLVNNTTKDKVDVERYLEDVEVTVDGKAVEAKWSVDRDAKVTISFDDVEVAAKKKVEFAVNMSFDDEFDSYDRYVKYSINETDFNATDVKTESRVKTNVTTLPLTEYGFLGGKVKFTNVKLGNIDASYGAVDVKVAEGEISTTEPLRGTFTLYAKDSVYVSGGTTPYTAIETMKVSFAGEEYEVSAPTIKIWTAGGTYKKGDLVSTSAGYVLRMNKDTTSAVAADRDEIEVAGAVPYTFTNVDIEKAGKVTVKVDVRDMSEFNGKKIKFANLSADSFSTLIYDDIRGDKSATGNIAGFITLYDLTVQPAKAALKNSLTKAVEFINGESNTKVVFDGTYSAKNGTVNLTDWTVKGTDPSAKAKVTFYLSIDGEEIDDVKVNSGEVKGSFANVRIEEGESASIKIEAEVEGIATGSLGTFQILFAGEDENGNNAGSAKANTVELKVVDKGSISMTNDAAKATALRRGAGSKIAQFTVKPSNSASEVDFDTIEFTLAGSTDFADFDEYDVTLSIGEESQDLTIVNTGANTITYTASPFKTIDSNGSVVEIVIEKDVAGKITLNPLKLNGVTQTKTFSKYFVETLVSFEALDDAGAASYVYRFSVDGDSDKSVSNFIVYTSTGNCASVFNPTDASLIKTTPVALSDGDTVSIKRVDAVQEICGVTYSIAGVSAPYNTVEIGKGEYVDYFKIGGKTIDIPKAS